MGGLRVEGEHVGPLNMCLLTSFCTRSSIPTEKKNSPFKRDLHKSCKGWAVLKSRSSRLSMGHVVNMSNLEMGLLARKVGRGG